jgi:hydrogenase maturation protease
MIKAEEHTDVCTGQAAGNRILVAGIGNVLLRDDGVGVHAIRELSKNPLAEMQAVEVGCAVFDALHLFEWADKILLIDAMTAGGRPGSIYLVPIDDVEKNDAHASLHELSVTATFSMLRRSVLPEVTVIGIEPETIDYGLELTDSVQASLPKVLDLARQIVDSWSTQCEAGVPRAAGHKQYSGQPSIHPNRKTPQEDRTPPPGDLPLLVQQ